MDTIKCIFEDGYFKPLERVKIGKKKYLNIELIRAKKLIRKQMIEGYKEMSEINLKLAKDGLPADNEALKTYEEKLKKWTSKEGTSG